MKKQNVENAISRIHSLEKFGSILGLERMNVLMERLGNPQKSMKVIHVAGTNGKGSVCRYIYEALRENGYKVGLYTSPFLENFNERIEYDGAYISDEDLEEATNVVLEKVEEMTAEGLDSPTEFEVVTGVAFYYFSRKPMDYLVLEVGLGGRGDSTNIIEKPLISIITSISYDHMNVLGDDIAQIAWEKAGIIKEGCPVVVNVKDKEAAKAIARVAYEKNAVLYDVKKIKYRRDLQKENVNAFDTQIYGTDYSLVELSMKGEHQIENAMCALTAIEILRKAEIIRIERGKLYDGIKKAVQIGRFEVVGENPTIVIDGAHNEEGAKALVETIKEEYGSAKVLMVTGILRDKKINEVLDCFFEIAEDFIITEPDNQRRLPATELEGLLIARAAEKGKCIRSCEISSGEEAFDHALQIAKNFDIIVFAGSLYLIGTIRRIIHERKIK